MVSTCHLASLSISLYDRPRRGHPYEGRVPRCLSEPPTLVSNPRVIKWSHATWFEVIKPCLEPKLTMVLLEPPQKYRKRPKGAQPRWGYTVDVVVHDFSCEANAFELATRTQLPTMWIRGTDSAQHLLIPMNNISRCDGPWLFLWGQCLCVGHKGHNYAQCEYEEPIPHNSF